MPRQQRAAGLGLLVDQGDAGAGAGGVERGGQAGRAGADDEHVDVVVDGVVAGGVRDVGEPALTRDAVGDEPVVELDGGGQQHRLGNGSSICTRPPGSSAQAAAMPRGRPSLTLVAIWCRPAASSAEARVSPGWPVQDCPSKVNSRVASRSMRPPVAVRKLWDHGCSHLITGWVVEAVDGSKR